MYTQCDSFYCVAPPNGCTCFVQLPIPLDGGSYSIVETDYTVTNVQGCTQYLKEAFADYEIDFDDVQGIVKFLDYFGRVEEGYKCSGICETQEKYYFYNSAAGYPDHPCLSSIRTEMVEGELRNLGIGYTVAA